MRKIAEAYVDDENGLVLVKTKSGTYTTYLSTDTVEDELRRYRIRSDIPKLVAASLKRLIGFLGRTNV
ncbi:hypothetical protein SEA_STARPLATINUM_139 [Streptomyces phage StarPlatinum]|uniref:Uncharacterized protein n=1 Tax=Streptomyces phage StarPlatinum TaxID=2283265 RepID=A0A345M8Q6_9CAUD|nr:hypothetical protein HWB77_gp160 [Streptomyces phage StarPlatinum]AXH66877.1 hypothetical protein SEA_STARPLATINUM_139 [Streptomyces phage StarPlatinum]